MWPGLREWSGLDRRDGKGGRGGVLVEVGGVREGWLGVEGRAVVSNARPSGPPPPPPTADRPPRLLLFSLPLSDCTSTNGQLGQHCTVIRFFVYFPLIFVLNVCLFVLLLHKRPGVREVAVRNLYRNSCSQTNIHFDI